MSEGLCQTQLFRIGAHANHDNRDCSGGGVHSKNGHGRSRDDYVRLERNELPRCRFDDIGIAAAEASDKHKLLALFKAEPRQPLSKRL